MFIVECALEKDKDVSVSQRFNKEYQICLPSNGQLRCSRPAFVRLSTPTWALSQMVILNLNVLLKSFTLKEFNKYNRLNLRKVIRQNYSICVLCFAAAQFSPLIRMSSNG